MIHHIGRTKNHFVMMLSHQSLLHWLHFLQFFQAIFCGSNQILLVLAMTTNSELLQHFVFLYFFSLYFQMFLLHPACDYLFAYILHLCIFVFCILFHLHPASDYLFTIDADKINSSAPPTSLFTMASLRSKRRITVQTMF